MCKGLLLLVITLLSLVIIDFYSIVVCTMPCTFSRHFSCAKSSLNLHFLCHLKRASSIEWKFLCAWLCNAHRIIIIVYARRLWLLCVMWFLYLYNICVRTSCVYQDAMFPCFVLVCLVPRWPMGDLSLSTYAAMKTCDLLNYNIKLKRILLSLWCIYNINHASFMQNSADC